MNGTNAANSLLLIGGGGHALVVAETAFDSGWTVAGFFDDREDAPLASLVERRGGVRDAVAVLRSDGGLAVMCVGDLAARAALLNDLSGVAWARVRHPSATISRRAEIGAGVFLGARCVVNIRANVGDHAIINTGAIVEHECVIGPNVHIAPGAVLCGNVRVGAGTLVGAGARVIPGVTIGERCLVGAGAVVVRDVPDGLTVVGVPARSR
jgi:acetyltransferase EpsM